MTMVLLSVAFQVMVVAYQGSYYVNLLSFANRLGRIFSAETARQRGAQEQTDQGQTEATASHHLNTRLWRVGDSAST